MFCFLCQRQSVKNMVQVSIFLGAFPEKCNIWRLAQRSCAAVGSHVRPRKMLCWIFWSDRKEKQGLVSVSGCKHFSMIFFLFVSHSSKAECLACVLGTLPLQAVEILLEVSASTAAFLFLFFSFLLPLLFSSSAYGLWQGVELQVRAE